MATLPSPKRREALVGRQEAERQQQEHPGGGGGGAPKAELEDVMDLA